MIKFTAIGVIYSISPVVNVGENFQKREIIIDDTWIDREQNAHPNFVAIEFSGERMALLDQFQPGQRVCVDVMVNGREYNGRYFTSLRGLNVTLPAVQQQQPTQSFAQPAPAPAYPQSQAYPQQGYQQPQAYTQQAYPQPTYPQAGGYGQGNNSTPFH